MMRLWIAALFVGLTSACVVHGHAHGPPIAVQVGHVHGDHCGHYHWKGGWYGQPGHRHHHGCGHHFRSGMWIAVD